MPVLTANAPVTVAAPVVQPVRTFVGRAWKNTVVKEGSKSLGMVFINIKLDHEVQDPSDPTGNRMIPLNGLMLNKNTQIQLWPNAQRAGSKDADYRLSIIE